MTSDIITSQNTAATVFAILFLLWLFQGRGGVIGERIGK